MSKGLLIDYQWCTGCHSCEMACRKELGLPDDEYGIKLTEFIWPHDRGDDWQMNDKWQYTYLPVPLDLCDLCAERTSKGKLPSCVHHCQSQCMYYGEVEELAKRMADNPRQALFGVTE